MDIKNRSLSLNPSISQIVGVGTAVSAIALVFQEVPANAEGTVPKEVQSAIDNTTATVGALGGISLAAVAAALVPFGAALALSFVHKVMSKA